MIGSVIPGVAVRVSTRLANYADLTRDSKIKKRKVFDPIVKFPDMNAPHGSTHPILEKLRQLMTGPGPQHPHAQMGTLPLADKHREGYQPIRENLQWRQM